VAARFTETAGSLGIATSAAYAAKLDHDIRDPFGTIILIICIVFMTFGFLWSAVRVIWPKGS
jgi:Flp pilus assembly protein TadB